MRMLVWLCIFYFIGSSCAQAQSAYSGTRFFPPDDCVPGETNFIAWNGPGYSTRCIQVPLCTGEHARLQYDGANFQCASGQPPCLGPDCPLPTRDTCPPQDVAWQVGINSCGASLPAGTDGQVVTVPNKNAVNLIGTAQYVCVAPAGRLCPPGALCPDVMSHWELLDGATCQRTACPGPGCPDIRPQASMESSSGIVAPQR